MASFSDQWKCTIVESVNLPVVRVYWDCCTNRGYTRDRVYRRCMRLGRDWTVQPCIRRSCVLLGSRVIVSSCHRVRLPEERTGWRKAKCMKWKIVRMASSQDGYTVYFSTGDWRLECTQFFSFGVPYDYIVCSVDDGHFHFPQTPFFNISVDILRVRPFAGLCHFPPEKYLNIFFDQTQVVVVVVILFFFFGCNEVYCDNINLSRFVLCHAPKVLQSLQSYKHLWSHTHTHT